MSDPNGTIPVDTSATTESAAGLKGKGKAVEQEPETMEIERDVDSSSEESGNEQVEDEEVEEEDDDNMEEIDTENIVGGRTRGKQIDYVAAERMAKEAGEDVDDDDDEDDEDFEEEDAMEE